MINKYCSLWLFLLLTSLSFTSTDLYGQNEVESKKRSSVLIVSPVRQKPAILSAFLRAINNLDLEGLNVDFCLIDDNDMEQSSNQLTWFLRQKRYRSCIIRPNKSNHAQMPYVCNEQTHCWNEELVWRVASFKNGAIERAVEGNYDYLFLVDSDVILQPKSLKSLISCSKDIVCNIYWTSWQPGTIAVPQVWLTDQYNQYRKEIGEHLTSEEAGKRFNVFIEELKQPGVYEVGGVSGCVLISRKAMLAGLNFNRVSNLTLWGADRHFSVRAAALDFKLYVDTHYPAIHVYRESDLKSVPAYF